jgi:hypothetical protein
VSQSAKRRREPDDDDRLKEVLTAFKQSVEQDTKATAEAFRTEVQQTRDRIEEVSNRIATTGILTERDGSELEAAIAKIQEHEVCLDRLWPPFPRAPTFEARWEQSGHTDTTALHGMLARFVTTHLPVLCSGLEEGEARQLLVLFGGLNEVILRRQQPPPDRRDTIRWLLVFAGRYVKRLTWQAAYEYASKQLAGTSAGGSRRTMKRAYMERIQSLRRAAKVGPYSPT